MINGLGIVSAQIFQLHTLWSHWLRRSYRYQGADEKHPTLYFWNSNPETHFYCFITSKQIVFIIIFNIIWFYFFFLLLFYFILFSFSYIIFQPINNFQFLLSRKNKISDFFSSFTSTLPTFLSIVRSQPSVLGAHVWWNVLTSLCWDAGAKYLLNKPLISQPSCRSCLQSWKPTTSSTQSKFCRRRSSSRKKR